MRQKERQLRVIGSARSGTSWLARTLRKLGLDVGHEYTGLDGTVSCYFLGDPGWYPVAPNDHPKGRVAHVGERLSHYRFRNTVMLVRNPLKTIGSLWALAGLQYSRFLEELHIIDPELKPKLLKSMHIWYGVNRKCSQITDQVFRLEHLIYGGVEWNLFCDAVEIERCRLPDVPPTNRSHGIFLAKPVTWEMMLTVDKKLTRNIKGMAKEYGY